MIQTLGIQPTCGFFFTLRNQKQFAHFPQKVNQACLNWKNQFGPEQITFQRFRRRVFGDMTPGILLTTPNRFIYEAIARQLKDNDWVDACKDALQNIYSFLIPARSSETLQNAVLQELFESETQAKHSTQTAQVLTFKRA